MLFLFIDFSYHVLESCKSLSIFLCSFCKERQCFFKLMGGYDCVCGLVHEHVYCLSWGSGAPFLQIYPYNSVTPRTSFLALTGARPSVGCFDLWELMCCSLCSMRNHRTLSIEPPLRLEGGAGEEEENGGDRNLCLPAN